MSLKNKIKKLALKSGIEINRYNTCESAKARFYRSLEIQNITNIVDIGANTGGYAKSLREGGFKGNILSFEPLIEAHTTLLELSKEDPKWFVADRMAIGDENGEIEINIAGNSVSSSILPMKESHSSVARDSSYIGSQKTPLQRLSSIDISQFGEDTPNFFLKIDTQGYEMPVLNGALPILDQIQGVQLELSLIPLYEGQALYIDIIHWLEEYGFELWNIFQGFSNPNTGQMLQMDGVFFKKQ